MSRLWDILATVFFLVGVFLVLFYWQGTRNVITAVGGVLTDTVATLQGQTKPGRSFPAAYPSR